MFLVSEVVSVFVIFVHSSFGHNEQAGNFVAESVSLENGPSHHEYEGLPIEVPIRRKADSTTTSTSKALNDCPILNYRSTPRNNDTYHDHTENRREVDGNSKINEIVVNLDGNISNLSFKAELANNNKNNEDMAPSTYSNDGHTPTDNLSKRDKELFRLLRNKQHIVSSYEWQPNKISDRRNTNATKNNTNTLNDVSNIDIRNKQNIVNRQNLPNDLNDRLSVDTKLNNHTTDKINVYEGLPSEFLNRRNLNEYYETGSSGYDNQQIPYSENEGLAIELPDSNKNVYVRSNLIQPLNNIDGNENAVNDYKTSSMNSMSTNEIHFSDDYNLDKDSKFDSRGLSLETPPEIDYHDKELLQNKVKWTLRDELGRRMSKLKKVLNKSTTYAPSTKKRKNQKYKRIHFSIREHMKKHHGDRVEPLAQPQTYSKKDNKIDIIVHRATAVNTTPIPLATNFYLKTTKDKVISELNRLELGFYRRHTDTTKANTNSGQNNDDYDPIILFLE